MFKNTWEAIKRMSFLVVFAFALTVFSGIWLAFGGGVPFAIWLVLVSIFAILASLREE